MCGIFGYIGEKRATPILLEGLRRLEYRGYDSTGIVVRNGILQVHKTTGKVEDLKKILPLQIQGQIGISHTRWATHGEVNDINAHPHLNSDESIAIVHNGILDNARVLRNRLTNQGVEIV